MQLITFNGPRGSGKDTCFNLLTKALKEYPELTVIELSFKSILYGRVAVRYNLSYGHIKELNEDPKRKLMKRAQLGDQSVVQCLIHESEEVIKKEKGSLGVAALAIERVRAVLDLKQLKMDDPNVILLNRDGGFEDEQKHALWSLGINSHLYCLLRIERPGCTFEGDSRSYLPRPTVVVKNNNRIAGLISKMEVLATHIADNAVLEAESVEMNKVLRDALHNAQVTQNDTGLIKYKGKEYTIKAFERKTNSHAKSMGKYRIARSYSAKSLEGI